MIQELYRAYAFIFGLLVGSFLNVVILRLPVGKNITFERSACPHCKAQLKWFHNIPLLSFLILLSKCAFCGAPISWRYPLIELLMGLISFWLFPEALNAQSTVQYFFYFTIACTFVCHFFIDLDHQLLLDKLNLYLLAVILPYVAFNYQWQFWALGGALGFLVPLAVTWVFYKIRGQVGLGGGDIKLFGVLGLLLGPVGIFMNIFFSCFIGAVVGLTMIALKKMGKDRPMAFGPSILLVATVQIFFPGLTALVQSFIF